MNRFFKAQYRGVDFMDPMILAALGIVCSLVVYLGVALLVPERFS